jgi:hypothetical protein
MVFPDDVHVRDQREPREVSGLRRRCASGWASGARGSVPCRAGPFAEHRGRSKMQHSNALEAEPRPGLRWCELRMHTCADTRRGDGRGRSSRKKTAGGRDPFFSNGYYPDGR